MDLILDFFLVSSIVIISIILVQLIKNKQKQLPQKILILVNLFHFTLPFLSAILITIPTILFNHFKIDTLSYTHSSFIHTIIRAESLYFILYIFISFRLLSKYRRLTKYKYSDLTQFDFNWIKIMLLSASIIMFLDLGFKVYKSYFDNILWNTDFISVLAMIILVIYLGYYGIHQSKVLLPSFLLQNDIESKNDKTKPNNISSKKEEEYYILKKELELLLSTTQPYLDEELTLGKLAQQISTTDKTLSTMLNRYMNTTFYDLINGFKSSTTFNRIFKKETGLSPSDYKKSLS